MNPGRKRILVVDTDPELLINLEQILEDGGYATTTTWDTGVSLDLLDSQRFDLLLVGNHPPEIDAAQIVTRARRAQSAPHCLVMQSRGRFPFEAEYLCHKGADAVVRRSEHAQIAQRISEYIRSQGRARAASAAA